jgi:hypothetical protein
MQPSDAISATFTQTPRVIYKISRLSVLILTLFIVVLTVVGLNWLQYASQAGLTAGYPKPTVHITPSTSGTLLLRKPITFQAQGAGRDVTYSWSFDDTNTNTGTSTSNDSAPTDGGTAQGSTAIYA